MRIMQRRSLSHASSYLCAYSGNHSCDITPVVALASVPQPSFMEVNGCELKSVDDHSYPQTLCFFVVLGALADDRTCLHASSHSGECSDDQSCQVI